MRRDIDREILPKTEYFMKRDVSIGGGWVVWITHVQN